jgi:hypothetical protein
LLDASAGSDRDEDSTALISDAAGVTVSASISGVECVTAPAAAGDRAGASSEPTSAAGFGSARPVANELQKSTTSRRSCKIDKHRLRDSEEWTDIFSELRGGTTKRRDATSDGSYLQGVSGNLQQPSEYVRSVQTIGSNL